LNFIAVSDVLAEASHGPRAACLENEKFARIGQSCAFNFSLIANVFRFHGILKIINSLFPAPSRGVRSANVCSPPLSHSPSLLCLHLHAFLTPRALCFQCPDDFIFNAFFPCSFKHGEAVDSHHNSLNDDVSAPKIAQSRMEASQIPVAIDSPRCIPDSNVLVIPIVEPQRCVKVNVTQGPASIGAKIAPAPQVPPQPSVAADDDYVAEEEKWRTDRFFLGTDTYIAINPRALTEKCASGMGCPFHPFCDFAHDLTELRDRPLTQMWNFKTKLCDKFHSSAACCPYGNRW